MSSGFEDDIHDQPGIRATEVTRNECLAHLALQSVEENLVGQNGRHDRGRPRVRRMRAAFFHLSKLRLRLTLGGFPPQVLLQHTNELSVLGSLTTFQLAVPRASSSTYRRIDGPRAIWGRPR
jgi:hypothetical protein